MASSVLCNSCVLRTQELAAITQQLRANELAFAQRKANEIKVIAGTTQVPPPPPPWPRRRYPTPSLNQLKADCRLCDLLATAFPNEASHRNLEILPFRLHWSVAKLEVEDFEDMCIRTTTIGTDPIPRLLLAMSDNAAKPRFGRLRKIKKFIEWATLTSWIDTCGRYHGTKCKRQSGRPGIQGLKLIDCERRVVVKATVGMNWVALSYVWSLATPRHCPLDKESRTSWQPESEQDIKPMPSSPPGIISDAMDATLALGYRYLWADQFCIDQSNKEEVADQVGKMDQIYRGADLTIVAASARNGLPGTRALPREEPKSVLVAGVEFFIAQMDPVGDIAGSVWSTRGWCYQEEILSRRLLYFTEAGALFKCASMNCYEQIGGPELAINQQDTETKSRVHQVPLEDEVLLGTSQMNPKSSFDRSLAGSEGIWDHSITPGKFNMMAVREIIAEFTKKRLSFDVDSLNAVIGVLTVFEGMNPPVFCCRGLPVSQNLHGHFEDSLFLQSLYWFHTDPASAQRRAQFPSWSWAGWNGSIGWIRLARDGFNRGSGIFSLPDWDGLNLKHDARVLALTGGCDYSPDCNISTVTGFDQGTTHDCRFQASCSLSKCKFILLDSRVVPASFFNFRQPGNRAKARTWEDLEIHPQMAHQIYHHPESPDRLFLVRGYEGALLKYTEFLSCDEFLDRVRKGQLECIFLGEHIPETGCAVVCIHLLVVEWISPTTAQRFCFLTFVLYYSPSNGSLVENLFSSQTNLPRKQLWLV